MIIKELQKEDEAFLKEMFYKSLFVPEGKDPYPRSVLNLPGLTKYYVAWGKDTDIGLFAEIEGEKVGAVWCRFFTKENKGYGFVDENTPEMGIALKANFRNQGMGTVLIKAIFEEARKRNIKAMSLSVDSQNRALNLYKRLGFFLVKEEETAFTMKKRLGENTAIRNEL